MIHFSSIRASGPPQPLSARIFRTLLALLLGAGLGALAKALDGLPSNALPFLLDGSICAMSSAAPAYGR